MRHDHVSPSPVPDARLAHVSKDIDAPARPQVALGLGSAWARNSAHFLTTLPRSHLTSTCHRAGAKVGASWLGARSHPCPTAPLCYGPRHVVVHDEGYEKQVGVDGPRVAVYEQPRDVTHLTAEDAPPCGERCGAGQRLGYTLLRAAIAQHIA